MAAAHEALKGESLGGKYGTGSGSCSGLGETEMRWMRWVGRGESVRARVGAC